MPEHSPPTDSRHRRCIALPRGPQAASHARWFLRENLPSHLGAAARDNVQMVVSELVNNAFVHGTGDMMLLWELRDDRLRVEVVDEGTGQVPAIREQSARDEGGWGLRIVDTLALEWGAFEGTTHVWADLPLG